MADGLSGLNGFRAAASISNLGTLFHANRYEIPPYQRDYCWKNEHVKTLLMDLFEAFDSAGPVHDGLVPDYFLGAIVTQKNERPVADKIVDGQQRLTTLLILLAILALHGSRKTRASALELIYRPDEGDFGTFVIDVHEFNLHLRRLLHAEDGSGDFPARVPISERYKSSAVQAFEAAFSLCNELVLEELAEITASDSNEPDSIDTERIDLFFSWLIDRVYLAHIYDAEDEQCVFDRMNTRGLQLSDGQKFLSRVLAREGEEPRDWRASREKALKSINRNCSGNPSVRNGLDAEKRLLSGFLIAKKLDLSVVNAQTIREAKALQTNPYNWMLSAENSALIVKHHGSAYQFLRKEYFSFPARTAKPYSFFNRHDADNAGFFHASIVKLPFVDAAIAAAVTALPKNKTKERLKALSDFFDVLAFYRCWAPNKVTPRYLDERVLRATHVLSSKPYQSIRAELFELVHELPGIAVVSAPQRTQSNARWMRYILARMEIYLSRCIVGPRARVSESPLITKGSSAHELEHILSKNIRDWGHIVGNDPTKMEELRQRFGALSILPKDKNRAASNLPFEDRLEVYKDAGWLSKVLLVDFYNGGGTRLVGSHKDCPEFGFRPWHQISIEQVTAREQAMVGLADRIWSTGNIVRH
ncbi:MAG: DUF262 domain-containing HNH endonuclease family protein [Pseudomonadota bacterium]